MIERLVLRFTMVILLLYGAGCRAAWSHAAPVLRTIPWAMLWSMGLVAELRESCWDCAAYYTMGDTLVWRAGFAELRRSLHWSCQQMQAST
jgi:hypothetical protein